MKRLLILTFLATASAQAIWPFASVKKAQPLTQADKVALAQQAAEEKVEEDRAIRIKALKEEYLKNNPDPCFQSTLECFERKWGSNPAKWEDVLLGFHNAHILDHNRKEIQRLLLHIKSREPYEEAKKLFEEMQGIIEQEKKSPFAEENATCIKFNEQDIPQIKGFLNKAEEDVRSIENCERIASENKAQAIAGYSDRMKLSDTERASIYKTNPGFADYDWFQKLTPDEQKVESERRDKATAKLNAMIKKGEDEEDAMMNRFAAEMRKKSMEEYEAKMEKIHAAEAHARHEENERELVQAAKDANDIARQAVQQAHSDAVMQQNSIHSGTIYYDNGRSATYQGN